MKYNTIFFNNPVFIEDTATLVGPKEKEGPLGDYFDKDVKDDLLGQKSYENAEIKMRVLAFNYLLNKTKLTQKNIDLSLGGDLSDELTALSFAMKEFEIPYFGLYNACATFGENIIIASLMLQNTNLNRIICSVSSHFSTAERQYRFPLELGNQRTPLSQWTVTGTGLTLLNNYGGKIAVDCATIGRVIDFGVKDVNNMGGAMAPAAMDALLNHLKGTGRNLDYYDLILTGDLGEAGSQLLRILLEKKGYKLGENYNDCGVLIYNRVGQDVGQGGSGPACSGCVFNGYVYKEMITNKYKKVLLLPTGALLSKNSSLQGKTIPSICHAVSFKLI